MKSYDLCKHTPTGKIFQFWSHMRRENFSDFYQKLVEEHGGDIAWEVCLEILNREFQVEWITRTFHGRPNVTRFRYIFCLEAGAEYISSREGTKYPISEVELVESRNIGSEMTPERIEHLNLMATKWEWE